MILLFVLVMGLYILGILEGGGGGEMLVHALT